MSVQIGYVPNYVGPGLQLGRVRRTSGSSLQFGRYRVGSPFRFRGDAEGTAFLKRTTDRTPEMRFAIDAGATLNSFTLVHSSGTTYGPFVPASGAFDVSTTLPLGVYQVRMVGVDAKGISRSVVDRLIIYTLIGKLWRNGQAKLYRNGSSKLWRRIES